MYKMIFKLAGVEGDFLVKGAATAYWKKRIQK
jgi:hypothetical protein